MISAITFMVEGIPQTKGSAKAFVVDGVDQAGERKPRAVITNDNVKAKGWQRTIAWEARRAVDRHSAHAFYEAPMQLTVWFYFPRPKKFRMRKYAALDVPHVTRPDTDKCLRVVKDALSRVVWRDDCQVVDVHAHKRYCADGEVPRVVITVNRA